jgi:hypothetical protein
LEFVNEGDPFNGNHYAGANQFARYIHQINVRPMLATTSFWHSQPSFWNNTDCDYVDVHRYVGDTTPYGLTNAAVVEADPDGIHGRVIHLRATDITQAQADVYLDPIPVTPGHTYRLHFLARARNVKAANTHSSGDGPGAWAWILDARDNGVNLGNLPLTSNNQGTYGWMERISNPVTITNSAGRFLILRMTNYWATGDCWFDNIRLEDVTTGKTFSLSNGDLEDTLLLANDTSLFPTTVWKSYVGGGPYPRAFNKPWMWGECSLAADNKLGSLYRGFAYNGQDQRVYDDTTGVWLHTLTWGGICPAGSYPLLWWTEVLYAYNLQDSLRAYRAFMADVALANGSYTDVAADSTGGLRARGQKDVVNGRAHLWIDNPDHTWVNVVNGTPIAARTGTVSLGGFVDGTYTAEWWDTRQGVVLRRETVKTTGGVLTLSVQRLMTDVAVKLSRSTTLTITTPVTVSPVRLAPVLILPTLR